MTEAVVVVLTGVTTGVALGIGTRGLRLRPGDLATAAGKLLECLGLVLVFFTANAALGLVAILGVRSLTGAFVSTYAMSDVALVGISFIQGLLFFCWRETKPRRRARALRAGRSDRRAESAGMQEGS
jgi:hypothetical protein